MDLISTIVVITVFLLSFLNEYIPSFINIDKIASIGMAIYIFYTATKIIISNIRGILVNDKENEELKDEIINKLSHYKSIKKKK